MFAWKDPILDWSVSLVVGFLTVSHWRGLWTLLDIWTCQQPSDASLAKGATFCFAATLPDKRFQSAVLSYAVGAGCTLLGWIIMWLGGWKTTRGKVTLSLGVIRVATIYILGLAAVSTWRGVWYLTDQWILPSDPLSSYWLTSFIGAIGAFALCSGGSLLAPPAIFLLDGPSVNPPPLAVTIVSTYYALNLPADTKPPKLPIYVCAIDVIASFFVLPIFVVWFWRGSWLLMDFYLWGFTDSDRDINISLAWSCLISLTCCVFTSEPSLFFLETNVSMKSGVLNRIRIFFLAWGTVNFWRVVWFLWDQFLGGTSIASAWAAHAGSFACLLMIGCASCIAAPPSTLGVDSAPCEGAADEPLFSMLPLPWDLLFVLSIFRGSATHADHKRDEKVDDEEHDSSEVRIEMISQLQRNEIQLQDVFAANVNEDFSSSSLSGSLRKSIQFYSNELLKMSYHDLQRPHLNEDTFRHSFSQRPSLDNSRNRSSFYRNR